MARLAARLLLASPNVNTKSEDSLFHPSDQRNYIAELSEVQIFCNNLTRSKPTLPTAPPRKLENRLELFHSFLHSFPIQIARRVNGLTHIVVDVRNCCIVAKSSGEGSTPSAFSARD